MEFKESDLYKFYELHNRINIKSRNVGIIGDTKRFKRVMKRIYKQHRENGVRIMKFSDRKYTFILNDVEYSYIQVENTQDLIRKYF